LGLFLWDIKSEQTDGVIRRQLCREDIADAILRHSDAIKMLELLFEALDENYRRVVQETYPEISAVGGFAVGG